MAIVVSENKFIDKLKKLGKGGMKKSMSDSMNWFKNKVKEVQGRALPAARKLRSELEDQGRLVSQPRLGQMYFYRYDPKFKDKLPYYDTYPLIFPFKYESSPNPGFWGVNLHYLFLNDRAILMDALTKYVDGKRLNLTEGVVKTLMRSQKRIVPCIKRYVYSHVQGKGFVNIDYDEWDYAFLLPVQQFEKKTAATVWKQSKEFY